MSQSFDTIRAGQEITRNNYHWGQELHQAAGPITFGFRTSAAEYPIIDDLKNVRTDVHSSFEPFSPEQIAATQNALQLWSDVANINFVDRGHTNDATITFSNYTAPNDGFSGFAYLPETNNQASGSYEGDVYINRRVRDGGGNDTTIAVAPGSSNFRTLLHEIGHAIGLDHPGNYNAAPGRTITYEQHRGYDQDSHQYTVMSYFNARNTGADFAVSPSTPMMHDIAAIQRLYGANNSTRTGDTDYGFSSNAGSIYKIDGSWEKVAWCIWDAGGTDTLDFSGYAEDATVYLKEESFSNIGGSTKNVSIAKGVTIENAFGGRGNDRIEGNEVRNDLRGNEGNDTLFGRDGDDTLQGGNGNDNLKGDGGKDIMDGGAGDDSLNVDNAGDVIREAVGGGNDLLYVSVDYRLAAGVEIETVRVNNTTAGLHFTGNEYGQAFYGGNGNDTILGGGGNDSLKGGQGDDFMEGGAGNDRLAVDSAGDVVREAVGGGVDLLFASVNYGLSTGIEIETMCVHEGVTVGLRLTGNEFAQSILGGVGLDTLDGGAGNDTIAGGDGSDTMTGGLGNDTLRGGAGNDTFVFRGTLGTSNVDHLTDFSSVADSMQLSRNIFTALAPGQLSAGAFKDIGAAGATVDTNDRIIYNHDTGVVFYDANGSGAGARVQFAVLDNHSALTSADFFAV